MKTISYETKKSIPLLHEADVIVVGGGPGGLGAAVMAARAGARVLLIERYGFLGGMATAGEVHPFMQNHANGICLDKPVYIEWIRRMQHWLGPAAVTDEAALADATTNAARMISKDAAMLAAEELCLEAGVRLLYHHTLADVVMDGRRIDALVLLSKSGFTAALAKVYVDCTGDADLAAGAGCACEQGGPGGQSQPMTLCFKLAGLDVPRCLSLAETNRLFTQARESGEIQMPRDNILQFGWYETGVVHFNTTRVTHRSGTDGAQLSEAEIEGRRQLRQLTDFLRRRVPGYENVRVHSVAAQIGVRESRRVKGLATVTRDDFRKASKFPDAIARVHYPIDIHNPLGAGTEHERLPPGEFYEIPYGCIVPADGVNIVVGGRPISGDHAVHSSFRVMPPACSIGQAAGLAAAVAASRGRAPRDLDGVEIRAMLRARGACL